MLASRCIHEQPPALLNGVYRAADSMANGPRRLKDLIIIAPLRTAQHCLKPNVRLALLNTVIHGGLHGQKMELAVRNHGSFAFETAGQALPAGSYHKGFVPKKVDLIKVSIQELQAIGLVPALRPDASHVIDLFCNRTTAKLAHQHVSGRQWQILVLPTLGKTSKLI